MADAEPPVELVTAVLEVEAAGELTPADDTFTPAPRDNDRVGALERRLGALEDLALALAEAVGDDEPRVAAAVRKLRSHSRG